MSLRTTTRTAILAAVTLSLAGCAGSPARYRVDRAGEEKRMAAEHDTKCRGYGAKPGTPAYVNCMTQMDATDKVVREMAEDEAFDIAGRNTKR